MHNFINVLEQYYAVVPTPETTGRADDEMTLPLTFFDILWIKAAPVNRLVFYQLPLSRSQFVENYIPNLKDSLISTLKNFFPLAGNFVITSDYRYPKIQYCNGDGVSIIFAESLHNNFNYLTSNNLIKNGEFYPLIPQLIEKTISESEIKTKISPVLALQVTLFPCTGICVGITNHHVLGDGSSIFGFMKTWALISNNRGGNYKDVLLPHLDRSVIKDPNGFSSLLLNQLRSLNLSKEINPPSEEIKIRQTFVLLEKDILKLKNLVRTERANIKHVSALTITCAYVLACLTRSVNEEYVLILSVNCRGRVNPPIPLNYFGNCLTFCLIKANPNQEFVGDPEAFFTLVDNIGDIINKKLQNKDKISEDAETWVEMVSKMNWNRTIWVAGSPKFNYYDLDFGWGKPIKFEFSSIDKTSVSFSGCRDSQEAATIEIGMCNSKEQIQDFARVFDEGLEKMNSME